MKVALYLMSILLLSSCSTLKIQSEWGKNSKSNLQTLENKHVFMSVSNCDDYLYLTISTDPKSIEWHIQHQDLIIWIDNETNNQKKYGLKFSLQKDFPSKQRHAPTSYNLNEVNLFDRFEEEFVHYSTNEISGLTISNQQNFTSNIYTIKVPLNSTHEYMPKIMNETISVGLETLAHKRPKTKATSHQNKSGMKGKRSSQGRNGNRKKSGGIKQHTEQRPQSISLWTTISLAKQ